MSKISVLLVIRLSLCEGVHISDNAAALSTVALIKGVVLIVLVVIALGRHVVKMSITYLSLSKQTHTRQWFTYLMVLCTTLNCLLPTQTVSLPLTFPISTNRVFVLSLHLDYFHTSSILFFTDRNIYWFEFRNSLCCRRVVKSLVHIKRSFPRCYLYHTIIVSFPSYKLHRATGHD